MTKSRNLTTSNTRKKRDRGSSQPKTAMRTVGSKSKRSSKVAFAPRKKSKKERVPSPSPSSIDSSENDEDSDAMDVDAGADADDVPNLDPVAALAVGHLILDDPTHRMYQQHVDSLLNASDSVRFEELVQHLRRKGEELGNWASQPKNAEATPPQREQVDTLGLSSQARTQPLSPSRAPYQHELPANRPVPSRPVMRGAVADTVDVVPDINLIAKGVDFYWDLNQLRAVNMDAVRLAISSTLKRARDLFCINVIAEAEFEANLHHPFVFDIRQLCDQAVLDWMQLPHNTKERWFARFEKLLTGDVRTFVTYDTNSERRQRKAQYGLSRHAISHGPIVPQALHGPSREQQPLHQSGDVGVKSEDVSPALLAQADQPPLHIDDAPPPEQQVRSALLIITSCHRTARQMEKTCAATFSACGYLSVQPRGMSDRKWLVFFEGQDGASQALRRKPRIKKQAGDAAIYEGVV
ncbi:hypothetical protein LTR10_012522 [Elasticomyces elasticus]|nr:hypothetical protein LTR10_012522 [Elasticomyces elasticus]KAK4965996.1 hypothetical protein LTR42_012010 [Elasticomyces elasticus]